MEDYSKTKLDYVHLKPRRESKPLDFLVNKCDIHGKFGEMVYRHKRNGEMYSYRYKFVPKYSPTVLSRRQEYIFRCASRFTNSSQAGYQSLIDKMFYYTPYVVYSGDYGFSCNRFLKLCKRSDYRIQVDDGVKMKMRLAPRSKLKLEFENEGEFLVKCYKGDILHSERKIVVIAPETDLAQYYADWFDDNLPAILQLPAPEFARLEKYFRCIIPPDWILSLAGEIEKSVLYSTRNSYLEKGYRKKIYMYSRRLSGFIASEQTRYFGDVMPRITTCWMGVSAKFNRIWEKYYSEWYELNYNGLWRKPRKQNFWSRLIFRAGKSLEFDLKTLSKGHFLPGIDTIGELIKAAEMGNYALSNEELETKIF